MITRIYSSWILRVLEATTSETTSSRHINRLVWLRYFPTNLIRIMEKVSCCIRGMLRDHYQSKRIVFFFCFVRYWFPHIIAGGSGLRFSLHSKITSNFTVKTGTNARRSPSRTSRSHRYPSLPFGKISQSLWIPYETCLSYKKQTIIKIEKPKFKCEHELLNHEDMILDEHFFGEYLRRECKWRK